MLLSLPVQAPDRAVLAGLAAIKLDLADGKLKPAITVADPLGQPAWDEALARWPAAAPFHASPWLRTLSATYGHQFWAVQCASSAAAPGALLLVGLVRSPLLGSRLVSLPFADEAPLLGGAEPAVGARLLDAAVELAATLKCRFLELRGSAGIPDGTPVYRRYHGHLLDLRPDAASLWHGLAAPVRTAVRHAERAGVRISWLNTRDAVADYYELHCGSRRRQGAPPQPWSFFSTLAVQIIEPGHGFIALAAAPGSARPCAGAVFLKHRDQAVYKFGASNDQGRQLRANNLLMWRAVCELRGAGARQLHFGRTDLDQAGLRRFKLGWGAAEFPLHYHRLAVNSRQYQQAGAPGLNWAGAIWRSLPDWLNRAAGRWLYRHLH
jgi:hypothetical protein